MALRITFSSLFLFVIGSVQFLSAQISNYSFSAKYGTFEEITVNDGAIQPTLSGGNNDEGYFNNIPIGFNFEYRGVDYDHVSASTNGFLLFGSTLDSAFPDNNLYSGSPRPLLAPLWDDLSMAAEGSFLHQCSGLMGLRVFTAQWLMMIWKSDTTPACISFQIKLDQATNSIEFIYRQEAGIPVDGSASIGINESVCGPGSYLSLSSAGPAPEVHFDLETTGIQERPLSGQCYTFTPPMNPYSDVIGQITYNNNQSTPIQNVQVQLKSLVGDVVQTTFTDTLGRFSFLEEDEGTYILHCSATRPTGGINSIDALLIGKHFIGLQYLSEIRAIAADVNQSGDINSIDALLILKRYVEAIPAFIAGNWLFESDTIIYSYPDTINIGLQGICYGDVDGSFIPERCIPEPVQADAGVNHYIDGTTTTLEGNTPLPGTGMWILVSGTGGVIEQPVNPNSGFSGMNGNSYTLAWVISTVCGFTSDTVIIHFFPPPFLCGDNFTDPRDNQIYGTVQIGSQCWMRQNLNVGTMINGSSTQTDNGILEKYCQNDNASNCDVFGGLYQWAEMMQYSTQPGIHGICPDGWHLPTSAEWSTLNSYLGGTSVAGGKMKEPGNLHWTGNNVGATNESGFTAYGGGLRDTYGVFQWFSGGAFFWSSSPAASGSAWRYFLRNISTSLNSLDDSRGYGFSVRCIKGCPDLSTANAGTDHLNAYGNIITLNANIPIYDETGTWSIVSGLGGSFSDIHDPSASFSGIPGEYYTLRWTISNLCDLNSYDETFISFTDTFLCGTPFIDTRDGRPYGTVLIGSQCWMSENLNVGVMSSSQSNNGLIEKRCQNNDISLCEIYGGLYKWDEMMLYTNTPGIQGICPAGWHLPELPEWCEMVTFVDPSVDCNTGSPTGTNIGGVLKETGTQHWNAPNTGANNLTGFTALGAGGGSDGLGNSAYFWTSTNLSSVNAWYFKLKYNTSTIERKYFYRTDNYSVRCIKY